MAKAQPFGTLVATLMLAATLAACGGGAGGNVATSGEGQGSDASATSAATGSENTSDLTVGALASVAESPAVAASGAGSTYATMDELVAALRDGAIDVALVSDAEASVLYNALEGKALAVDAVQGADEMLVVSVVTSARFSESPESVVSYVAAHGAVGEQGELTFYSGLAMQDAVSLRIKQAYAADPSSVGGSMPPDNFYFLG